MKSSMQRFGGVTKALVALLALAWLLPPATAIEVATRPLGPGSALAGETGTKKEPEPLPEVDAGDVYFGRAKRFKVPAEIDADAVYAEITEYQRIQKDGLGPDDVEYQVLLSKASRSFHRALRKAAKDGGYDLVAQLGAVRNAKGVPDITRDVIDAL